MGASTPSVLDRLRRPEYTGENRCTPCTAVNVAIAALVSGGLWFVWEPLAPSFLALALASIYLRGYLVPGTPTLTKRYFPDRVLRWFDKAPAEDAPVAGTEADIDPEPVLLEAGAVEFCMGGEDLCATEEFAREWRGEIERLRDDETALAARIADLLDADPGEVSVVDRGQSVLVQQSGRPVAQWESRAALTADAAAYPELADRVDGWDDLELQEQGRLLNGARVFLERCPACDGDVAFSEDTVESCCRSVEVVSLECPDCDATLLEVEA